MKSVFTYGTLMVPAVWQAVTGLDTPGRPAGLSGFRRYRIPGCVYPGIVHQPGQEVQGVLYEAVPDPVMDRLDQFEDDFYVRQSLPVRLGEECVPRDAEAYVVPPEATEWIGEEGWSVEVFEREHLEPFLRGRPIWAE